LSPNTVPGDSHRCCRSDRAKTAKGDGDGGKWDRLAYQRYLALERALAKADRLPAAKPK
jgi:hypothetical protein